MSLKCEAATTEAIDDVRGAGLDVAVWTVNDPQRVRALLATGVVAIITDLPAMAAKERDRSVPGG